MSFTFFHFEYLNLLLPNLVHVVPNSRCPPLYRESRDVTCQQHENFQFNTKKSWITNKNNRVSCSARAPASLTVVDVNRRWKKRKICFLWILVRKDAATFTAKMHQTIFLEKKLNCNPFLLFHFTIPLWHTVKKKPFYVFIKDRAQGKFVQRLLWNVVITR